MSKKVKAVTASGPTELETPEGPEPLPDGEIAQPPEPITEEKLVEILTKHDELVKVREDEKMHKMLDMIIEQLAANKPQTNIGTTLQAQTNEGVRGTFSEVTSLLREFGLMDSNNTGFSGMEVDFAKMLQQGYYNYLKIQQRDFARKMGLPWHEVESEHS